MTILTFDIETVPDSDALRKAHKLPADIADSEVIEIAQRLRRQDKGHDFLSLHYHRVVAIGCLLRQSEALDAPFKLFCLPHDDPQNEAGAVQMFFDILQKYQPTIVSWNGGGFDLPVLHYRAMKHGISAPSYWNTDGEHRWNNYISRYHERHTDLMDLLSLYQPRACVPLGEFAQTCGLPGKIGIGAAGVWDAWQAGKYGDIYHYCEADVLLTYLLYVRFQHFRGRYHSGGMAKEEEALREFLATVNADKWHEFLNGWEVAE